MEIVLVYLRDVLINGLAASGVVPVWLRTRWYRLLGMDLASTARIMPGCRIGGRNLTMGEESWLYYDCHVDTSAQVTLGRNVSVSTGVTIVTAGHDIGPSHDRLGPDKAAPIVIEDGVWIGIGATVAGGVTIRRGCVIAAGALVTRSTKPDGLYAGYPAKRVRDLDPDRPGRVGPKHGRTTRDTWSSSRSAPGTS